VWGVLGRPEREAINARFGNALVETLRERVF